MASQQSEDLSTPERLARSPTVERLERLLTIREVTMVTSLHKNTIYRRIAEGLFPQPMRISANRVAWRASDVVRWQTAVSQPSRKTAIPGEAA